jgi:hypothetical protein
VNVRFVGLISPVGQMGLGQELYWPTVLAPGAGYLVQALDDEPNSFLYPQTTMQGSPGTTVVTPKQFNFSHPDIGVEKDVLDYLVAQAQKAGVPVL